MIIVLIRKFKDNVFMTGKLIILLICLNLISSNAYPQSQISNIEFLQDCDILKQSLQSLHPGLYRYLTEEKFEEKYKELTDLSGDISLSEAFLRLSEFIAAIKCGHTVLNPYNQNDLIQREVIGGNNKLPFTFDILRNLIVVTSDGSGSGIARGSIVVSINGVDSREILERLRTYADGDGSNDGQRLSAIKLTGNGMFEFSDIYLPLCYPPVNGKYDVVIKTPGKGGQNRTVTLNAMSRDERKQKIDLAKGTTTIHDHDAWSYSSFGKNSSVMTIPSFVTYDKDFDWEKFLSDSFDDMAEKKISNLIIDIRGNSGGTTRVAYEIISRIAKKPVRVMSERFVCYETVPDNLRRYLTTWDNSFFDRRGTIEKFNDRLYRLVSEDENKFIIEPKQNVFTGKVYLLVDESNSSATFFLAKLMKENGLATLAGRQTGGNQKGITGGNLFFLELPNSGIEIDIPLIATIAPDGTPDSGIIPDIMIEQDIENFTYGIDTELEYLKSLFEVK